MNDPYPLIQSCERLQKAATEGNVSAFRQRLEELGDLLADNYGTEPTFSEMHETANDLAQRAKEAEELISEQPGDAKPTIPDPLQQRATTLTQRVCECILQTGDLNTESLAELVTQPTTDAIESFVAERDKLEAENVLLAAKARSVAERRDTALNALEGVIEQLERLDINRSSLEASRHALREAERREREANEQASRIDDMAKDL